MPIYIYRHPHTEEMVEIVQGMHDDHEYHDSDGLKWPRVFTAPSAAFDLDADPFSHAQFIEKTQNAGTMGELWDRSAELSQKRANQLDGRDPYKKKYLQNYSKGRGGNKHLSDD